MGEYIRRLRDLDDTHPLLTNLNDALDVLHGKEKPTKLTDTLDRNLKYTKGKGESRLISELRIGALIFFYIFPFLI